MLNYSAIITEEDGKIFLCDVDTETRRCTQARELETDLQGVRKMLRDFGYPDTRQWVEAVRDNASEGLRTMVAAVAKETAGKLDVPAFMVPSFIKSTAEMIPAGAMEAADSLSAKIARDLDGLPVRPEAWVWMDDRIIDVDRISLDVIAATRREVAAEDVELSKKILSLAGELRALELSGLNAIELAGKYARMEGKPAEFDLYNDVATRRHLPGVVPPDAEKLDLIRRIVRYEEGRGE